MTELTYWLDTSTEFFLNHGILGLIIVAFTESSFFLVPPDLILIPMGLYEPKMALWYALIATSASAIGGLFGYFIGNIAGRPLLDKFVSKNYMKKVDEMFAKYGAWGVAIVGFTPIPFKVITIASGIARINIITFIFASILGRGARFFLEGIVIMLLGPHADKFLGDYMGMGTIIITLMVITGYLLIKFKGNLTKIH